MTVSCEKNSDENDEPYEYPTSLDENNEPNENQTSYDYQVMKEISYPISVPDGYRLTKELIYSSSTSTEPNGSIEYLYDDAGKLIKKLYYSLYDRAVLYMYRTYEYSNNNLSMEKIFDGVEGNLTLGLYIKYYYSGKYHIKEETYVAIDNSLASSIDYGYENNNLIKSGVMKYEYNDQNRLILEENTLVDLTGLREIKYTKHHYDDKDREIKIEYFNPEWTLLQSIERKYEGNNLNPSEEISYDKNGNQMQLFDHTLDEWGNITERIVNGVCVKFKRKYEGELLKEAIHYYGPEWQCSEAGMTRYEYEK
jgi:hypothetical protein